MVVVGQELLVLVLPQPPQPSAAVAAAAVPWVLPTLCVAYARGAYGCSKDVFEVSLFLNIFFC